MSNLRTLTNRDTRHADPEERAGLSPRLRGAPTHDFNEFLHHLRSVEIGELRGGASTVLSGGCSGSWYFEWFASNYPTQIERHIGVEAYVPRPADLPDSVEWVDSTLGDMSAVADASVDLVFAGQVIEHLWADEVVGFLRESHRVLRPGGRVCIDSPTRDVAFRLGWRQPEHTVELDVAEARNVLRLAGFGDISIRGVWLCVDPETGEPLPIDIDGGGHGWPWERRVTAAASHPEQSFVWWATAVKADDDPLPQALSDHVRAIFDRERPRYLSRTRHEIGWATSDGRFRARRGQQGRLVCGPGVAMPPGSVLLTFTLTPGPVPTDADPASPAVRLAVADASGRVIAERTIALTDLGLPGQPREHVLPVEFAQTTFGVDFEVWSTGTVDLVADPHVRVSEEHTPGARLSDTEVLERRLTALSSENRRLTAILRLARPLRALRRMTRRT